MSLWTKSLADVAFDDVQVFCEQEIAEGTQLDYKVDIPSDLAKVVASFANTTGGLIIIGVADSDSKPVLPIAGMPGARGISERITEICRDNIYPPILPEISEFLPLPDSTKRGVVVLRVHQSMEAPHAIKNRSLVYIRTGSVSSPIELGDIDRIERMLRDRGRLEEKRESMIDRSLRRFAALREEGAGPAAVYWYSLLPVYPQVDVATVAACKQGVAGYSVQTTQEGAIGKQYGRAGAAQNVCKEMRELGRAGNCFLAKGLFDRPTEYEKVFHFEWISRDLREFLVGCAKFYESSAIGLSGYLSLSVGLNNVKGATARIGDWSDASRYLEDSFRTSQAVLASDLLDSDFPESPTPFEVAIWDDLRHAFDLPVGFQPKHALP